MKSSFLLTKSGFASLPIGPKREGIVNKVTDLRLSPGLCEKMLVVPEFLGSESLLVNEIASGSTWVISVAQVLLKKGKGVDRIGDYHAGIYFFLPPQMLCAGLVPGE